MDNFMNKSNQSKDIVKEIGKSKGYEDENFIEDIASEFTLQDLLFVIGKTTDEYFTIGKNGEFMINDCVEVTYNLSKSLYDNLDDEQFCEFIYQLIVK